MVTIATHILNKYLPNKTLPTYTFLSCKQTHQTLATTVYKTGHSPLNTTISQHLVKIHLIGEQIQNISDLQSTDIKNIGCAETYTYRKCRPQAHICMQIQVCLPVICCIHESHSIHYMISLISMKLIRFVCMIPFPWAASSYKQNITFLSK